MNGRPLLTAATVVVLSACAAPPRQAILITIDSLRDDHVGPRRPGASLTPELDRLEADSLRFSDTLTSATTTMASHASMLTGLRPQSHGLAGNDGTFQSGVTTLAQRLRAQGVRTGAVVSSYVLRSQPGGLSQGFESYDESFDQHEQVRSGQRVKSPEATTRAALAWIQAHRKEPFFLWVHYFPPHGPYAPPARFLSDAGGGSAGQDLAVSEENYERGKVPKYQRLEGVSSAEEYRLRYAGHVRYVDHYVGELLAGLRALGIYDRALLIGTADHGESLGEHDWYFCHGNLAYQEQARVPLMVKWPRSRGITRRQSSAPAELVDVMPTVLQHFGVEAPAGLDGQDLARLAQARGISERLRVVQSTDGELTAVVLGPMKLIERRGQPRLVDKTHPRVELFRLDRDPAELRDLSGAEPELVQRLTQLLPRCRTPLRQDLSKEAQEQLRTLGYLVSEKGSTPCPAEPETTPSPR